MSEIVDDVAHNIRNEQRMHDIDRNPTITCEICDDGKPWQSYWKWRINTPEDRFICDDCLDRVIDMHDRMTQNNP